MQCAGVRRHVSELPTGNLLWRYRIHLRWFWQLPIVAPLTPPPPRSSRRRGPSEIVVRWFPCARRGCLGLARGCWLRAGDGVDWRGYGSRLLVLACLGRMRAMGRGRRIRRRRLQATAARLPVARLAWSGRGRARVRRARCRNCGTGGTCSITVASVDDSTGTICAVTSTCDAAGECRKTPGQTCSGAAECASGNCLDGVCCTVSSCPQCLNCGTDGTCSITVTSAEDTTGIACMGTSTCDSTGNCQ
jgi:hypothetical protein